jgi:inner membrane protein
VLSHAVAALGIGACFYRPRIPKRVWWVGVACSVLPDIDVLGFRFGVRYGDFWGHRGFTHSLIFAALTASVALILGFWHGGRVVRRLYLWTYFFLAAASHGLLDAMTDGGLGGAFFSPFDNHRYFLPWRPIHVSPIGFSTLFHDSQPCCFRERISLDLASGCAADGWGLDLPQTHFPIVLTPLKGSDPVAGSYLKIHIN